MNLSIAITRWSGNTIDKFDECESLAQPMDTLQMLQLCFIVAGADTLNKRCCSRMEEVLFHLPFCY